MQPVTLEPLDGTEDLEALRALEDDEEESRVVELTEPQTIFTLCPKKHKLFLAGYGSGKSLTMAVNIINDLSYPGANIGAYAPTYDLLGLIMIPYVEEFLTINEIPYKLNKVKKIINVEGHGDIIFRSMDNPSTIVGYQVFRSHIDELDILDTNKAKIAWEKIIARNRQKVYVRDDYGYRIPIGKMNGKVVFETFMNGVSAYTTPEGFKFCYEKWEKNPEESYAIIRASTYSNAHNLPDDYIDTLLKNYPAELVEAYINGEFVNLTGGHCYPSFDREENHSNETIKPGDVLYVGMDFNVLKGSSIIHVLRDGIPHAVDEIHNAFDTDEQIAYLKENYSDHIIKVYPDASSKNRTASNTTETDLDKLYAAGFDVMEIHVNPPIKERVFSLSAMIKNGKGERRYFVNTSMCPEYTQCLEQQIWGDNGLPDKKAGLDHKPDAAGYYIHYEFPIVQPASGVTVLKRGHY